MKTFEELGIRGEILRAISEMGYENPMPVQAETIPYILENDADLVALAQTGTGKTAAFGLPVIQKVDVSKQVTQVLILSPTRELCLQIASDLSDYSKYVDGLKILPVYGGSSIESQIRAVKKGVQIVVATPGRLIDLMKRKVVKLNDVRTVIMDEADEMLNMGFSDSINEILSSVPEERSILLFSATMPSEIARIAKTYMKNQKEITIGTKNEGAENVKHSYLMVHAKDKYLALKRIADYYPNVYGIIFCRTRQETKDIAEKLITDGYSADSLHGDLSQAQRDAVMQKFRVKNIQLLVATDVAARGLDVDSLTHVINYGLPDDNEVYTHRSGRTGRAGKAGQSISILHLKEKSRIQRIERLIGRQFSKIEIPSGENICEKQLLNLVDKIEKVEVNETEIAAYLPGIFRKLEWLSNEDLIKRIVSLEFNRLLDYYRDAKDLDNPDERGSKRDRDRGDERGSRRDREDRGERGGRSKATAGMVRMFTNIGKIDGAEPGAMIGFIHDAVGKRVDIGKIDLMNNFSFFEVAEGDAKSVLDTFSNYDLEGRRIVVEVAGERGNGDDKRSDRDGRGGGYNKSRDNRGRDSRDSRGRDSRGGSNRREGRGGDRRSSGGGRSERNGGYRGGNRTGGGRGK